MSSGHDSTQYVVFPHTDISTDGTCKRQVILKRSGEGEINSSKVQAESDSNSLRQSERFSPFSHKKRGWQEKQWGQASESLNSRFRSVRATSFSTSVAY